jgi:hypothetical protein
MILQKQSTRELDMTETLKQITTPEQDREDFLGNNDRGFEIIRTEKDREELAREQARKAFKAIADQLETGHNID